MPDKIDHEIIDGRFKPVAAEKNLDLKHLDDHFDGVYRIYSIDIGSISVLRSKDNSAIVRVDFLPSSVLGLKTNGGGAIPLGFLYEGSHEDPDMGWSDFAFGFLGIIHIHSDDKIFFIPWADSDEDGKLDAERSEMLPYLEGGSTSGDPDDEPEDPYDDDDYEDEDD